MVGNLGAEETDHLGGWGRLWECFRHKDLAAELGPD